MVSFIDELGIHKLAPSKSHRLLKRFWLRLQRLPAETIIEDLVSDPALAAAQSANSGTE